MKPFASMHYVNAARLKTESIDLIKIILYITQGVISPSSTHKPHAESHLTPAVGPRMTWMYGIKYYLYC